MLWQVGMEGLSLVQLALSENFSLVVRLLLSHNCDLLAHTRMRRLYKCCLTHEDSHPHFDLDPIFLALTHRSVELMKLLVDCHWHVPVDYIKELDTVFDSTPDMRAHYSPELKAEIREVFYSSTHDPRSLQATCRAVIRERIGPVPREKVKKLGIAEKLKSFVMMDEYFEGLEEKIEENEEALHKQNFYTFQSVGSL